MENKEFKYLPFIEKGKDNREKITNEQINLLFTKKQQDIINKVMNDKILNKTEYEYYSRKIKKKIKSIIELKEFSKVMVNRKAKMGDVPNIKINKINEENKK